MKECGMWHSSIQLAARLLGKLERFTRILGDEIAFVHSCLECLTCNFVQVIGSPVVVSTSAAAKACLWNHEFIHV